MTAWGEALQIARRRIAGHTCCFSLNSILANLSMAVDTVKFSVSIGFSWEVCKEFRALADEVGTMRRKRSSLDNDAELSRHNTSNACRSLKTESAHGRVTLFGRVVCFCHATGFVDAWREAGQHDVDIWQWASAERFRPAGPAGTTAKRSSFATRL